MFFGDRKEDLPPVSVGKHIAECKRQSALPHSLWELINHSTCIQRSILKFFDEDYISYAHLADCCSKYAGNEVKVHTSKAGQPVKIVQSQKHITDAVKLALVEWQEAKVTAVLFPTVSTELLAEMVLPDKVITKIS